MSVASMSDLKNTLEDEKVWLESVENAKLFKQACELIEYYRIQ